MTCSSVRGQAVAAFWGEAQELLVAVAWVAGVGHLAGGHFQGGEQAGDAVPGVVICLPLERSRPLVAGAQCGTSILVMKHR